MVIIPIPEVTIYDFECACNDDFAQYFREAFESGDLASQLDELDTLEAIECAAH